jgi:hypothetical protein
MFAGTYQSLLPWRWSDADSPVTDVEAKVAILLLVPGFLFTRLDLPPRHTITARLRTWPTAVAYTYIGTSLAAALCIAAAANHTTRAALSVAIVVIQLLLAFPKLHRRVLRQFTRAGITDERPNWISRSIRIEEVFRTPDARFRAVGLTQES